MAIIPETYCEVLYTHYRDVVVKMSDVQKVQAALIPDGVNPANYEVLVSEITSSSSKLKYYNYFPAYTTLPALPNVADVTPLISCQIDSTTGTTEWIQFRITVRLKSNPADYATGIIKLVPTVNITDSGVGTGWSGSWTGLHSNGGGVGSVANSELELKFKNDGTWTVTHYQGDERYATVQGSGRWLPAGKSASNYQFAYSSVTGMYATSMQLNTFTAIPTVNTYHHVKSHARKISAGEVDDNTIYMSMVIMVKDMTTNKVTSATLDFENTAMA